MATVSAPWSRRLARFGRLVVAGALAAAALALPVGGSEDAGPREPEHGGSGSGAGSTR